MSSILRALKKVESDPRHQEEARPLESRFVPLAADTGPQKRSAGIIMMVIGGGLVCGLVVLAGWWFFAEKNRLPAVAPSAVSRQSLPPAKTIPAAPGQTETPPPAAVVQKPAELSADIPPAQEAAPEQTGPPSSPPIAQKAAAPVAGPAAEPAIQPPAPPAEIPPEAPAAKEAAATEAPAAATAVKAFAIPALNDPEIKLQAITWSKEPQKRIVVINNRILRQGETVSGYRIDTINQDDVELGKGGEKWQLEFRIK